MKSFVFALLLLIMIFLGICLNSWFLNRKIIILHNALFELATDETYSSEENLFKIENLQKTWNEFRSGMRFAFRRDLIRDFDESMISLKAFAKGESYGDFLESVELGLDLIEEMEQNNTFNFSILF